MIPPFETAPEASFGTPAPKRMKPEGARHYFKELRFRQLRAFCQTAHTGSFSAAADELSISRPALWNQVRSLESEFNVQLIRLRGRRVELTDDGQLLFDLAAPVVEAFDAIVDLFAERHRKTPRTLAIATTASLLNNELRKPLDEFKKSHTDVCLRFVEGPSRECVRRLEAGVVDLAMFGYLGSETMPQRLHLIPMGRYPVILVHAKDNPLINVRRPDARVLAKQNLILPAPDTGARLLLDGFFSKAGVLGKLHIVIEAENAIQFANRRALSLGALLTTTSPMRLAELQSQSSKTGIVARALPSVGFEQIHCARRAGHSLSPAAMAFMKLVLDDAGSFSGQ